MNGEGGGASLAPGRWSQGRNSVRGFLCSFSFGFPLQVFSSRNRLWAYPEDLEYFFPVSVPDSLGLIYRFTL